MNNVFDIDSLDACNQDEWSWMWDHCKYVHVSWHKPLLMDFSNPVISLGPMLYHMWDRGENNATLLYHWGWDSWGIALLAWNNLIHCQMQSDAMPRYLTIYNA